MTHLRNSKRSANLVNLDPAAAPDSFEYEPVIDIKELISLEDVMTDLEYGPNGGLVYCFEYVSANPRPYLFRLAIEEHCYVRYLTETIDICWRTWTGWKRSLADTMTTILSLTVQVCQIAVQAGV